MSSDRRTFSMPHIAGLLAGLVTAVTLFLFLRPVNASFAKGELIGGLGIVVVAALLLRARRADPSTLERVVANDADERDRAVVQHALAIAGGLALFWTTAATFAVILGAPAVPALAVALWGQLLTLVAGWWRASSRH